MPADEEGRVSQCPWMREGAEISAGSIGGYPNWGNLGNFSHMFCRETRLIFIPVLEESEPAKK